MTVTSDPWGQRQITTGKGWLSAARSHRHVMDTGLTGAHGEWE